MFFLQFISSELTKIRPNQNALTETNIENIAQNTHRALATHRQPVMERERGKEKKKKENEKTKTAKTKHSGTTE